MAGPGFRERMALRDKQILNRVGDRATLAAGGEVLGTFENPFLNPQLGAKGGRGGLGMQVNADAIAEPRFNLPAADAVRLPKGSILTIELPPHDGGGRYEVVRPESSGDGWVALILKVKHERTADILT